MRLLAYCCAVAVVAAAANNQNSHYDVLRVRAHATEDEILAAFDERKAALEQEVIDRDADVWFQQNKDQQIASKFELYDGDANGLLSRDEAARLLAELGIESMEKSTPLSRSRAGGEKRRRIRRPPSHPKGTCWLCYSTIPCESRESCLETKIREESTTLWRIRRGTLTSPSLFMKVFTCGLSSGSV